MELWYTDEHTGEVRFSIKATEQLVSKKSAVQQIDILDTPAYGRVLILDGGLMTTEKDEFIYHEMLAHVPMAVHPNVKNVLVIGGGDTGSDCVGTATRQGAASVTQIEIMPKPPEERSPSTPWPLWPYMLRTSSSHLEGCTRRWDLNSLRFTGRNLHVTGVEVETVKWEFSPDGKPLKFAAVPDTKEVIKADLVFLAMGFTGVPTDHPIVKQLELAQTPRTALISKPEANVYCVGDCANGASLVVRALAHARKLPL